MSLSTFLSGLFGGGLTYPALQYLFNELESNGVLVSAVHKRLLAYVLSLLLSLGALLVAAYLGYTPLSNETVFTAFATAFTTSQLFHMKDLRVPTPS